MSRASVTRLLRIAWAVTGGAMLVATAGCAWEVGAGYPSVYYEEYPPDAYIVTTEPVYFDGHATYWYGAHWYYRDGGRWRYYEREPSGLHERRLQVLPTRRVYEAPPAYPARRPSARPAGKSRPHR